MKKDITIYDIAEASGVSVSTVSRILNNSPSVSPKKRAKVQAVIEELGYRPNSFARGLMNKRTMTIGVLIPDISNPYFSSLFLEVQKYALEFEYSIILYNTLFEGSSHGVKTPFSEIDYFHMLIEKQVDGVLIAGGQLDKDEVSHEYIDELNALHERIPVVAIGKRLDSCKCFFVERNLGGGVSILLQHLFLLGHRHIAFVGGEPGVTVTTARLQTYRQTLQTFALPYDERLVSLQDYYMKDGYDAMETLLQRQTNFHAVIAINDMVAKGAIRSLADHEINVPQDVAVVSCDQFPDSEYQVPRLTGIDQKEDYLGKIAILQLISAIKGTCETIRIQHVPELIIRESCGATLSYGKAEKENL